jgi:hypothetical protein
VKLFGFLQNIFERHGPEKGTFIFLLSFVYLLDCSSRLERTDMATLTIAAHVLSDS